MKNLPMLASFVPINVILVDALIISYPPLIINRLSNNALIFIFLAIFLFYHNYMIIIIFIRSSTIVFYY